MKIFLRKTRYFLLTKSKYSKYILYAAGEILLVIIGILIALQINNANEIRKKEKTTVEIFKQIQQDLIHTVNSATYNNEIYRRKDSLINLVLKDKFTYNDYKGNDELIYLVSEITPLYIHNNGFKKLQQYIDYAPEGNEVLLRELSYLYINHKSTIEALNEYGGTILKHHKEYKRDNKEWFWELEYYGSSSLDSSAINYFLTDPYYKNFVANYYHSIVLNQCSYNQIFRMYAIDIYDRISDIVKHEDGTESEFFPFYINLEDYQNWVGKYKGDDNGEDFIFEISIINDTLFGQINDFPKMVIFPLTDTKFHLQEFPAFFSINKDENKNVISLSYSFKSKRLICDKIE